MTTFLLTWIRSIVPIEQHLSWCAYVREFLVSTSVSLYWLLHLLQNVQIAINWMQDPARCQFGPVSCSRAPILKGEIHSFNPATPKVKILKYFGSAVRLAYAENSRFCFEVSTSSRTPLNLVSTFRDVQMVLVYGYIELLTLSCWEILPISLDHIVTDF